MASKCVAAEQYDVEREDDGSNSYSELLVARTAIEEPHRPIRVVGENHQENEREVQEVAVHVLENERQIALAAVAVTGLADSAAGRVRPEALVVCAAIVVAGEPESGGERQDQKRW